MTEWLETNGLGGYALGCVDTVSRRRYHSLLTLLEEPSGARIKCLAALEVFLEGKDGSRIALSSHAYKSAVLYPDGTDRIIDFTREPWPTWDYRVSDKTRVCYELFMPKLVAGTYFSWSLESSEDTQWRLLVRPFFSFSEHHALHRKDSQFEVHSKVQNGIVSWDSSRVNFSFGAVGGEIYLDEPDWYYDFYHEEEDRRGYDSSEDLFSPGIFQFELTEARAVLFFGEKAALSEMSLEQVREKELQRRNSFASDAVRSADSYLIDRVSGKHIIAGYPWFSEWGRDSLIAVRGLCLAQGKLRETEEILLSWCSFISQGMVPNRLLDGLEEPEYHSVDASLWFVVVLGEFLEEAKRIGYGLQEGSEALFFSKLEEVVFSYRDGTRYEISADVDGLLKAGVPGVQLTWMDAKVDGVPVTPRIGKPVEIQALWINALAVAERYLGGFADLFEAAKVSFQQKFWNVDKECLFDIVDLDHVSGSLDDSLRPNQIFAVGGLPLCLLEQEQAAGVVSAVERELLTSVGLRSLAPNSCQYRGKCYGSQQERDVSYHQGTVWFWLLGPFVEAWIRVRGSSPSAKDEAKAKFVNLALETQEQDGLGHFSEIFDGDYPHEARGCPFQAWSLAEIMRIQKLL